MEDIKTFIPSSLLNMDKAKLKDANILSLSFVGDSVHTMFIRCVVLTKYPYDNHKLHIATSKEVNANRQSELALVLESFLNEDEKFVFKKGKNAHVGSIPKHSDIAHYKAATAFEAVLGYLYLMGNNERVSELLNNIYKEKGFVFEGDNNGY